MAGSTPIYGFPYPQSTDLVADYPTLGQELATDVETVISGLGSGLNLITPTSIANSGGSATLTGGAVNFTGVTSVSLNGCFTSTYQNYRVMVSEVPTAGAWTTVRWRSAGSDATGANYDDQYLSANNATIGGARRTGQTSAQLFISQTGGTNGFAIDVYSPAQAAMTIHSATGIKNDGSMEWFAFGSRHTLSTAYDGFTMTMASGTFTGTVRVYGLRN